MIAAGAVAVEDASVEMAVWSFEILLRAVLIRLTGAIGFCTPRVAKRYCCVRIYRRKEDEENAIKARGGKG